jgi:hypothetical protein
MYSRRLTLVPRPVTKQAYQIVSHVAFWQLLHRDGEFRSGSWSCENAGALQRSRMAF